MKASRTRIPSRAAASSLAAALAVLALAACGEESAQELSFTLSQDGKAAKIAGPASAEAGVAEITLQNDAEREGELQLIRVEGDHSVEEAIEVLSGVVEGKPFPSWFFAAGGVAAVPAGESATVTQVLRPGTYFAFDLEGEGPPKAENVPEIEVSGEESDEEVEADVTVSAIDYGFEPKSIPAGEAEIRFENAGKQPHHLIASPLLEGATPKDVETFFKAEKGKPPLSEDGTVSTTVIEGGESQLVTLDLKPGRYAFYCFIADREGGPPHAFKGMIDAVEVE